MEKKKAKIVYGPGAPLRAPIHHLTTKPPRSRRSRKRPLPDKVQPIIPKPTKKQKKKNKSKKKKKKKREKSKNNKRKEKKKSKTKDKKKNKRNIRQLRKEYEESILGKGRAVTRNQRRLEVEYITSLGKALSKDLGKYNPRKGSNIFDKQYCDTHGISLLSDDEVNC